MFFTCKTLQHKLTVKLYKIFVAFLRYMHSRDMFGNSVYFIQGLFFFWMERWRESEENAHFSIKCQVWPLPLRLQNPHYHRFLLKSYREKIPAEHLISTYLHGFDFQNGADKHAIDLLRRQVNTSVLTQRLESFRICIHVDLPPEVLSNQDHIHMTKPDRDNSINEFPCLPNKLVHKHPYDKPIFC